MSEPYEFRSLYECEFTEPPERAQQRELAAHCADLMDAYDDQRCRFKTERGDGIPTTPEERKDCMNYAREIKEELLMFARLLGPLDPQEWREMVLEETRRKNERDRKR